MNCLAHPDEVRTVYLKTQSNIFHTFHNLTHSEIAAKPTTYTRVAGKAHTFTHELSVFIALPSLHHSSLAVPFFMQTEYT